MPEKKTKKQKKTAGSVANSLNPDQMQNSAMSDLGLHCLIRPVCLNTKSTVSMVIHYSCKYYYTIHECSITVHTANVPYLYFGCITQKCVLGHMPTGKVQISPHILAV